MVIFLILIGLAFLFAAVKLGMKYSSLATLIILVVPIIFYWRARKYKRNKKAAPLIKHWQNKKKAAISKQRSNGKTKK
jgi:uncharacterized protein YqfA (UPF0365 family)